jgi:unsaturated rhamnogalacturonyl hydrolase
MDQREFYPETSGSAGIACGILMAARSGLLENTSQEAAYRALDAILLKVLPSGEATGVSGETPVAFH